MNTEETCSSPREVFNKDCFGCDPDEILPSVEGSIDRSGLPMVLMSMLSDVQELIARNQNEEARLTINRVKFIIDRKLKVRG